jgi:hypothetical protein
MSVGETGCQRTAPLLAQPNEALLDVEVGHP